MKWLPALFACLGLLSSCDQEEVKPLHTKPRAERKMEAEQRVGEAGKVTPDNAYEGVKKAAAKDWLLSRYENHKMFMELHTLKEKIRMIQNPPDELKSGLNASENKLHKMIVNLQQGRQNLNDMAKIQGSSKDLETALRLDEELTEYEDNILILDEISDRLHEGTHTLVDVDRMEQVKKFIESHRTPVEVARYLATE
ncbi:hypothetical protein KBB96_09235 [Luteolibacter ambystomatis]|uniref:Uncharacterized protein n=1 Tax=Luteolibacter ambystomatis TaxID=2824561 RepID=A0A975J335_9BACT|nr:hypothetical protein [Luteolibacter ambystomatis]QUE53061.1 hypothetical protein KBB96_09235 [Luteolibacter ambystomatis]